jgi:serine/threonine protein kinase
LWVGAGGTSICSVPESPPGAGPAVLRDGVVLADRYELTRPLQSGGMGVVWQVRDRRFERDVAMKFIHASLVGTGAEQRMLQEARALERLDHPAAARVYDVGSTPEGLTYLVLELLEGQTLLEIIDERWRIDDKEAVGLLLPIAGALASAHERGVIHRDVKPSNVIVAQTVDGLRPKLIDFGLAMLVGSTTRITQDGALVGTPAYVAPELTTNAAVDHRCDVWSLCVVLYHAIAGRVPFDGRGPYAIIESIHNRAPTPTTELRAGDAELWAILERGLAKNASDRWRSMQQLGAELARWAVGRGVVRDAAGLDLRSTWLQG